MKVTELLAAVDGKIKESAPIVADRVQNALVEAELKVRQDAFLAVLGKLNETKAAAKRIKPDGKTFAVGPDGLPVAEPTLTYSEAKIKELKQNTDEQKKLEDALNKALEGDFSKVKELAAKGGKPAPADAAE